MLAHLLITLGFGFLQLCVTVLTGVALSTNMWISDVNSDEGTYFERLQNMDNANSIFVGGIDGRMRYIGLWRMYTGVSQQSYPLPIRDPEMKMATGGYLMAIFLGGVTLFVVSLQVFGMYKNQLALEMSIAWGAFFQVVLIVSSTSAAYYYFNQSFTSKSWGATCRIAWVDLVLSILLLVFAIVRAILSRWSEKDKPKNDGQGNYQMASMRSAAPPLYSSPPSAGYNTGSKPSGAPAVMATSRQTTMQRDYDSEVSYGQERHQYQYEQRKQSYDSADQPRGYIR